MRVKLKKVRNEKDLTQQEVADRAGIERSYYTNIELGSKNPSLKTALKIKQALSYYEDDLFFNDECFDTKQYKVSI